MARQVLLLSSCCNPYLIPLKNSNHYKLKFLMEYLEWKLKIQIIFGRKIKIRQNVGDKIWFLWSILGAKIQIHQWAFFVGVLEFFAPMMHFLISITRQRSAKHFRASDPTTFFGLVAKGWYSHCLKIIKNVSFLILSERSELF